jgi:hypothetical protein
MTTTTESGPSKPPVEPAARSLLEFAREDPSLVARRIAAGRVRRTMTFDRLIQIVSLSIFAVAAAFVLVNV